MYKRCAIKIAFLIIFLGGLLTVPVYAVQKQAPQTSKNPVITVPAGEIINSVLTSPVNSNFLLQGHTVSLVVTEDFYYNSSLVIPADSMIYGNVISVNKTSNSDSADKIFIRFTQIVTPSGIQIPIAALMQSGDNSGVLFGNDTRFGSGDGHIVVSVGTPFALYLTQPITVNQEVYNSNY